MKVETGVVSFGEDARVELRTCYLMTCHKINADMARKLAKAFSANDTLPKPSVN